MNQSFRKVFVTNNATLLADGSTVDNLAVGQVAVLDAKTFKAVGAPTYAKNKALYIVQGTPDLNGRPLMSGDYDQNNYSKIVVGKNIIGWRAKAARRGQNQVITVGFSGDVTDTDTIFANAGEQRDLFITVSGEPIDKLYSLQGITRHYLSEYPIDSDCADVCAEVDRRKVAEDFITQINSDSYINKFVKASLVISCDPALDAVTSRVVYVFDLTVPDTQDGVALGNVQAQYPGSGVKRVSTNGINSTYEVQLLTNSLPAAFTNAGTIVIADCPSCPSGYTAQTNGYVYTVVVTDNGDVAAQDAVVTTYSLSGSGESASRINYEGGRSTYVLVSSTALNDAVSEVQTLTDASATAGTFTLTYDGQTTAAIAYNASASTVQSALIALSNLNPGDVVATGAGLPGGSVILTFNKALGNVPAITATSTITGGSGAAIAQTTAGVEGNKSLALVAAPSSRTICVLNTPSTTAWVAGTNLTEYARAFTLTVGDDICGNNRLTQLQALYPDLVVSVVDASGSCVHTYTADVYSAPVVIGCSVDLLSYQRPPAFLGVQWVEADEAVIPDDTTCLVGIRLETAFVNRITNECTFDYFPYEMDTIHITASTFDPLYTGSPFFKDWVVKQIQNVQYPAGFGAHVRKYEQKSLSYDLKERSFDPIVRELQAYYFQADPNKYYDEYVLEFDYKVIAHGWAQKETYTYSHVVYFPEGTGKNYEAAINAYITSANINLDPVSL